MLFDYHRLLHQYNIKRDNIYIVASSGVGLAKNTIVLSRRIKQLTKKNLEIISSEFEAKLLFKGCISKELYPNSLVFDIGSGNTKGGYIDSEDGKSEFFPLNLNLGVMSLTEKINKTLKNKNDLIEFNYKLNLYKNQLDIDVKKMYDDYPNSKTKKEIYFSGGVVWAFYSLTKPLATQNFSAFNYEEVHKFDSDLKNDFEKFVEYAKTNPEAQKVLKVYSQKQLIAGNAILMSSIENLDDPLSKVLYFAKQGQIAWLLSYVSDAAKKARLN